MKPILVVGCPINHSLSPIMHNAALRAMQLDKDFNYEKKELREDDLGNLVTSIRSGEVAGANVTIPYKTAVMAYLSKITEDATIIGAVNTLSKKGQYVVGENTDVQGFIAALKENGVNPRNLRVTIVGAGGAARAVSFALINSGVSELKILSRDATRAEQLARTIKELGKVQPEVASLFTHIESQMDTDLLVNCTPVGMTGHSENQSPISRNILSSDMIVMDIVYNPINTRLLNYARELGCKIIDGVEMLVHQGALSFKSWIGTDPPLDVMREAVFQTLGVCSNEQ